MKKQIITIAFACIISVSSISVSAQEYQTQSSSEIKSIIDTSIPTNTPMENEDNTISQNTTRLNMTLNEFQQAINNEAGIYDNVDFNSVFTLMQNSLEAGQSISLSDAFNLSGLTIPSNSMFDLSNSEISGTLDPTLVNYEYASLVSNMNKNTDSVDLSEQSLGAVNLFQNNYGDLANQLKVNEYSLPDNFSMQDMVQKNNDAVNNAYESIYKSGDYSSVRESIDVSSIFSQAQSGLNMPKTESASSLNKRLSEVTADAKSTSSSKKNSALSKYYSQKEETSKTYTQNQANTKSTNASNANNSAASNSDEESEYKKNVANNIKTPGAIWYDAVTGTNEYSGYIDKDKHPVKYFLSGEWGSDLYDKIHTK